ncbi:hypothetical protein [Flavobacterium flavipallidum]|uniref:Lumazine-binding protein n=1 Tax=Flavobacterium flavipallidum TaxID=3139140 RepID=A0ABU9HJG8_9FLAO
MDKLITVFILLVFNFGFSQNEKEIRKSLNKLSKEYLTEMYINKKYDSISKIWDKGMLIEIQSYYVKSNEGSFLDLVLVNKIKTDLDKYFKNLTKFHLDKILDIQIEKIDNMVIGNVFFEYQETIKSKTENIKTMLTFISPDNGNNWSVQDWKIKDIVDKVNRELY